MNLEQKIQDLTKEIDQLKAQLDSNNQQINQITTDIVKKVGAVEVLQALAKEEKAPDTALAQST